MGQAPFSQPGPRGIEHPIDPHDSTAVPAHAAFWPALGNPPVRGGVAANLSRVEMEEGDGMGIFKQMKDMKADRRSHPRHDRPGQPAGGAERAIGRDPARGPLRSGYPANGRPGPAGCATTPTEGTDFELIVASAWDLYAEISKAPGRSTMTTSPRRERGGLRGCHRAGMAGAVVGWNAGMRSKPTWAEVPRRTRRPDMVLKDINDQQRRQRPLQGGGPGRR